MIEHLCSKLKDKRKELGYRIEEVVEKTKLHPSMIRHIEAGEFNNISPAYLKGFIRIYASFLGVSVGPELEELTSPSPAKAKKPERKPVNQTVPSIKPKKQVSFFSPAIKQLVIFILVGIFALWALIGFVRFLAGKISSVFKKPVQQVSEEVVEPVVEVKEEKTEPVVAPDDVTVSLTVKRRCFIRVKADGKLLFEGVLKKGMIETWKADEELEFKISDGSAVYLEINGKEISQLTSMRRPIKSLKVTPKGFSVDK